MPAESLRELFVEELRDMYDGEKRLTKALPKMAKAAQSKELRAALDGHLGETREQVARLERALQMMDEPVRGKTCHGIKGIVEEGENAIAELEEGPLLDAAIIAGSQKVEHYEISSYGTLAYFAKLLGEAEVKALLGETLQEEKAADKALNELAMSKVNREALMRPTDDEAEEDGSRPAKNGRARGRRKGNGRGR